MKKQKPAAHAASARHSRQGKAAQPHDAQSPERKQQRKDRVLTEGASSMVRDIGDAVVLKDQNIFFLTNPDGDVPLAGQHGLGLYYHDCRFLSGYEMKLAGKIPIALVSTAAQGFTALFQMTNPEIRMADGLIRKHHLGIKWERTIVSDESMLYDLLEFQNSSQERIEFPISLAFHAGFEDVFAVRGMLNERPGKLRPPAWKHGVLTLLYEGADGMDRRVAIQFTPSPESVDGTSAEFFFELKPKETRRLEVAIVIAEAAARKKMPALRRDHANVSETKTALGEDAARWLARHTEIRTDSLLLNRVMERSLRDLRVLRSEIENKSFFCAGVPWFATLFGRDSIVTALQTLAYDPAIAEQTLRLLALYQGQKLDTWRDEQPGKILHELRVGEFARMGKIPHTPYYGTIDATALFLILLARHAAWTGSLALFDELRGNVERALEWMTEWGDQNRDGYIEYDSPSGKSLANRGWKDSGDAIVNADGTLAAPPISLVEVQAYAYQAKTSLAELYRRAGDRQRADVLHQEAANLCARFNKDFWLEGKGIYALALQAGGQPAAVVSSNAGHALWCGIADTEKARRTGERLMADDMFTGWGIRTLSEKERRYNPIGYHLGTVWPHDNSLIAAGFRRYGLDGAALRVFDGILAAAMHFKHDQLPELFAGFRREDFGVPVHYPVACHPQAWAAVAVPYLVETMLGLRPEGFERRLRIVRPIFPEHLQELELRHLRVGGAKVDLRFKRASDGVAVDVLHIAGRLDVLVEADGPSENPCTESNARCKENDPPLEP